MTEQLSYGETEMIWTMSSDDKDLCSVVRSWRMQYTTPYPTKRRVPLPTSPWKWKSMIHKSGVFWPSASSAWNTTWAGKRNISTAGTETAWNQNVCSDWTKSSLIIKWSMSLWGRCSWSGTNNISSHKSKIQTRIRPCVMQSRILRICNLGKSNMPLRCGGPKRMNSSSHVKK